jgi:hypothetical protein
MDFNSICQGSFKVVDFNVNSFPKKIRKVIQKHGLVYSDCILKEHLYSLENVIEHEDFPDFLSITALKQFEKLYKFMGRNDYSYIRFVS